MQELYLKEPKKLSIRPIEGIRPLMKDEVKVKLIYGGICGTDLAVYKGLLNHASYPIRPGHELVGKIVDKGAAVQHELGTRVVVNPNYYCERCDLCLKGHTNICRNKTSLGLNENGGFAEEFIIAAKSILPIPDDLPDEMAVLVEPLSVVIHALNKVTITEETTVAVVGCGNEGILSIALATELGAKVTAIDIREEKLEFVKRHWKVNTALASEVAGAFDIVIEAAGAKNSVELGIDLLNPGGTIVLIGITKEAVLPMTKIVRSEISILGSIIYQFPQDFLQAMEILKRETFHILPIISEIVPFPDYEKAYNKALSGSYHKILIDFKSSIK